MAKRKPILPDYGTVQIKGKTYYRTRVSDGEGNRISLYAVSREELYDKVIEMFDDWTSEKSESEESSDTVKVEASDKSEQSAQ